MSEEQQTPEIVSESPEVIITDNTSDTTGSNPEVPESPINEEQSTDDSSATDENDGEISSENEEIFAAFQQENSKLKQLLDEKSQQLDLTKAQYARLAADFENFRRRTAKEKENLDVRDNIFC